MTPDLIMLFLKYFLTTLRLQQQERSFKFFENFPEFLSSEISEYLRVDEQIKFGMTCKTLNRASNRIRDFETRKMMKRYRIVEWYEEEIILRELRTFSSVSLILFEKLQVYLSVDFFVAVIEAHKILNNLNLPNLILITLKNNLNPNDLKTLLRKVLSDPGKYKEVIKYLTKERYKCKRDQLIKRLRSDNKGLTEFGVSRLREYNYNSKNYIIIRDGIMISIKQFSIIYCLIYGYMMILDDNIPKEEDYVSVMVTLLFIVSIYITRCLNERYEQFME